MYVYVNVPITVRLGVLTARGGRGSAVGMSAADGGSDPASPPPPPATPPLDTAQLLSDQLALGSGQRDAWPLVSDYIKLAQNKNAFL